MNPFVQSTHMAKPREVEHKWYVVDLKGKVLGRAAAQIAKILMGKHKVEYTPHVDTGDYVIVVNADKVVLTGKKLDQKIYYRHSGYPGGLKATKARDMLAKHPERLVYLAVKGMLPKNRLGRRMLRKLKVYAGPEHPHEAQNPENLEI